VTVKAARATRPGQPSFTQAEASTATVAVSSGWRMANQSSRQASRTNCTGQITRWGVW
jgi:hypothetical protein